MKSQVLALSTADHNNIVNFAFCAIPEGMKVAPKNLASETLISELGLPEGTKAIKVCITGIKALPVLKKDLEFMSRTNLNGTTFEIAGASFKYNEAKSDDRFTYAFNTKKRRAELVGANISTIDLFDRAEREVTAKSAERRASRQGFGNGMQTQQTFQREAEIKSEGN